MGQRAGEGGVPCFWFWAGLLLFCFALRARPLRRAAGVYRGRSAPVDGPSPLSCPSMQERGLNPGAGGACENYENFPLELPGYRLPGVSGAFLCDLRAEPHRTTAHGRPSLPSIEAGREYGCKKLQSHAGNSVAARSMLRDRQTWRETPEPLEED